ncbi:hypothetical protein Aph02nite_77730 [Actinoplanes philippinensis]|uniref:hypothetical protein n=1 Tax=Actinoplanes philippinensis TaxID=35752 RepID=UPI00116024D7|nr:hypothetical protein [Actinoplanes philippinensis]GIE81823.1 hypothetical protein Aph02nite_77730 [Actinoplanes philippinensis]
MTDRRLLDTIHSTPWISDLLTLFDFEVARAADGTIEPVTLASGEPLEAVAGDSTGGCFLLVGTGDARPVLYVGSEGEGGLVAGSLRDALALVVGVSSLHDATTFPAEQNDGRDLRTFLDRADEEIRDNQPDLDTNRDLLRGALGLPSVDDTLLRALQAAAADFGYRPLNGRGDHLRPMLAWLEEAEEAAHPRIPEPPRTVPPSPCPHEPMPGQIALF